MDKGEILKVGFELHPAENGGFVVVRRGEQGFMGRIIAALGNGDAVVEWLRQEVRAADQVKGRAIDPESYLQNKVKGL